MFQFVSNELSLVIVFLFFPLVQMLEMWQKFRGNILLVVKIQRILLMVELLHFCMLFSVALLSDVHYTTLHYTTLTIWTGVWTDQDLSQTGKNQSLVACILAIETWQIVM